MKYLIITNNNNNTHLHSLFSLSGQKQQFRCVSDFCFIRKSNKIHYSVCFIGTDCAFIKTNETKQTEHSSTHIDDWI